MLFDTRRWKHTFWGLQGGNFSKVSADHRLTDVSVMEVFTSSNLNQRAEVLRKLESFVEQSQ